MKSSCALDALAVILVENADIMGVGNVAITDKGGCQMVKPEACRFDASIKSFVKSDNDTPGIVEVRCV